MKTRLVLTLKKKWFEMIVKGIKEEEYRELKPYWFKRLMIDNHTYKKFDEIEFTCGYPSKADTSKRVVFQNPQIRCDTGKPEWGAKENTLYFVISWES